MNRKLRKARRLLKGKRVMIFTGSGASQPSGIPTFSGPEALVDWGIERFRSDPSWRNEVWTMLFETYWDTEANPAHDAIKAFVDRGNAVHVTSNVDGLCSGVETCGTVRIIECDKCDLEFDVEEVRERWLEYDRNLRCSCGSLLRPAVTFIGEGFNHEAWDKFDAEIEDMEALVVIGASQLIGTWYPAVEYAREHGLPIVSINLRRHPWWKISTVHLNGDAAELTPQLLG